MKDIRKKTDEELVEHVKTEREALRSERFKDKASKRAGLIRSTKKAIARSLTELTARLRGQARANTKAGAADDTN